MTEQRDDLARLVTEENGKPFDEARREVAFATGYFSWFAEEARRVYGEIVPPPVSGKRLWVLRQPLGVVGAITPWNFPATMVTRKIAPALAAGCTVVLKPASATPLTALALARICEAAGLPSGVFNVLTSKNSGVIGQVFLDHPALRKIAFTGSTEVGKRLMAGASQQLKRVSFELGGNARRGGDQVPAGGRPVVHLRQPALRSGEHRREVYPHVHRARQRAQGGAGI